MIDVGKFRKRKPFSPINNEHKEFGLVLIGAMQRKRIA